MAEQAIPYHITATHHSNILAQLWDNLTRPHSRITDIEMRRQSRLLAGVLLSIVFSSILGQTILMLQGNPVDWFLTAAIVVVFTLYMVNRKGYYRLSATLTVVNHFIVIHMGAIGTDGSLTWLLFASTTVILAAIFLSFRMTLLVAVVSVAFQIGLGILSPTKIQIGNAAPFIVFVFTGSLMLVFMQHRTRLEKERRAELVDANRRLRESEVILEHRVEERTAELATAKQATEAALDKALEADKLKSQFLASMSHELRTPLNSILTFTELLEMETFGDVSDEQKDYLHKILFSGRHLLALINDVLDITKIQSGMLKLFFEDGFDIQSEMDMIAVTARNLLDDKPVQVVMDVDSDLPLLYCDKRRVRQVLLNLVSNAVKFTDEGAITLSAKKRGDDVLFAVLDSGPGIELDQQEVIFEPFVQTTTGISHASGTGLGLPISRKLTEAHGGRLWLESAPGEGSSFFASIPIKHAPEVAEPQLA